MNRNILRAILFDLDDTLYPQREYLLSGFRAVGEWAERRLGISQALVHADFQSFLDAGFQEDAFAWWLAEKGLPEELLPEMVQDFQTHAPRIALRPEAVTMLDDLRRASLRLGLVTQGQSAVQQAKVQALGLERWMQAIVILGEEESSLWKPNPVPYQRALAMLSVQASESVYIGDNPGRDFRGARALGMRTVRIRYADGAHASDQPAAPEDAPDRELDSLVGLLALLRKMWEA